MPVDTVLVSALGPDRRAACLDRGRLVRFVLTPPDGVVGGGPRAGDVYLGRITRVDRGLAAAFVDIGSARPGFLGFADVLDPRRRPAEGDAVVVRVLRAAEDGKGARLSGRPPPSPGLLAQAKTERPPARLQAASDPIAAAIAAAADAAVGSALASVVVDDAEALVTLRRTLPAIAPLVRHHAGPTSVFAADAVDDQLAAAMAPWQPLPGGGALAVRETPAAVAIDVDFGGAAGGAAAVLATNLEAMTAIAEAIVLGDLAGHIVIDPIAVRDRQHRGAVLARLREALAEAEALLGDERRIVRFGGFTPLGLIELVRERRGPSLRRQLGLGEGGRTGARAVWVAAGDALRAVMAEAVAHPGRVPALLVSEAVGEALAGTMAAARSAAESRVGEAISVRVVAQPPAFAWRLDEPHRR
jgi:ribonuclease G